MNKEDVKKAKVFNNKVVLPITCTEFDFKKAAKMEEEKITGKDREIILSCLKPVLDIIGVGHDDIYLYRPTPYYGFELLTRYFEISVRAGPQFFTGKYFFVFSSKFITISNRQKNLNFIYEEETGKFNKGKEFLKTLKKVVGMTLEKEEESLKEFAGLLMNKKRRGR